MASKETKQGLRVSDKALENPMNLWYSELAQGAAGLTLKVDRFLESTESEFQRIEVIQNKLYGKLLVLYGSLMVADNDNNAYNEMLAHVPLFSHPKPENVLIIGGGDCGTLTEVMKHPEVGRCTMCEIDRMVVDITRKHLPHLTIGADDPRAELIFDDGKRYIETTDRRFDVIALDLSDPVGPAEELFQKPFHQTVYDKLADDGIMVAQSESPYFNKEIIRRMYANLKDIFPIVRMYFCFMPIYPSALWSFAFCSKKHDPIRDFDRARWDRLALKTRYYNAETHVGAFALPQFAKELV
ncbi:MAG: polyamine aminopropyltransferase [candidate division Zixibacteria bacterium]|jgi:spermidine synthase|nr:polyamine aminopropyltransferase [candidate division Zixibacteria bacterium]